MTKLFAKLRTRVEVDVHPLTEASTLSDYALSGFTDALDALEEAAGLLADHEEALASRKADLEVEAEEVYAERVRTQKIIAKFKALVEA